MFSKTYLENVIFAFFLRNGIFNNGSLTKITFIVIYIIQVVGLKNTKDKKGKTSIFLLKEKLKLFWVENNFVEIMYINHFFFCEMWCF